VWMP